MTSKRVYLILFMTVIVLTVLACNLPGSSGLDNPSTDGSTPVGGASGSGGEGCNNPYYPVIAGATWAYSMTGLVAGNFTRTITAMTTDGFTDQDVFESGVTRTGQWKCDAGALIALDPGGGTAATANLQTENVDANFQTTSMDGVTFPAALNPGVSWTQNFTIEGNQSVDGRDVASKNQTSYNCTAGGAESIAVPAGTFEAMRIDCQVNMLLTITMNGAEIPTNVNFTSTAWHAAGVGMVKTSSLLEDGSSSVIELMSYNIP